MLGVTPSDSLDYTLQTIGLNTLRSYQLAPGTVCQLNFDGIDNQQMYFLPANISTSGQNISISYDRFINLNGNCIKDYSVIGAFKGLLLNYTKMYNTKNNGFCKYYIYLSAANCSSNCNSLSYNFKFYTFVQQPGIQKGNWFINIISVYWIQFVFSFLYNLSPIFNLFGSFEFLQNTSSDVMNLLPTSTMYNQLYINTQQFNSLFHFLYFN